MPFIRLSDDFDDHPKFAALSDGAFRLWCQVLAYSRRYETDGVVPLATVKTRRAYSAGRVSELLKPWKAGEHPLWRKDGDGIEIHDYLEWNHSKAENEERREQDALRKRRKRGGVLDVSAADTERTSDRTPSDCPPSVPGMGMDMDLSEGVQGEPSPPVVAERREFPDRRFQPRKLGRGVFAGALPADHLNHAACSPNLSWCVPNPVHTRLVTALAPRYQGDREQAHETLKAWYATVFAALPPDTVIADDFKFWRAKATAHFSKPEPANGTRVVPAVGQGDAAAALAMLKGTH